MQRGVWFTTVGTSPYAISNGILAAYMADLWQPTAIVCFSLIPDKQFVDQYVIENLENSYKTFRSWVKNFEAVVENDIELIPIECGEENYAKYRQDVRGILEYYKEQPRAIDITPGRKFASAIMMWEGIKAGVDSIFYLHLLDERYQQQPLFHIPMVYQKLVDIKSEVG